MELVVLESKNKDELVSSLAEQLNCNESEMFYKIELKKGGLFKSDSYKIMGISLSKLKDEIENFLRTVVTGMNLEVNFESSIRENQIYIKMYSSNNPILIGKNGQTLLALQNLVRQMAFVNIGSYPYVILDVENYKDKKQKQFEYQAKKIAKEVQKTKVDVVLDDMNSYDRKTIHNVLTEFKNITTESEGEEPHRHIVIKYKEEK